MLNGSTEHDGVQPHVVKGEDVDIVDIRQREQNKSLADMLRSSLRGGVSGKDEPTFPNLLLWDQQGLRLFEKITYNEAYYLTNTEIAILERHCKEIAPKNEPGSIVLELGSGNLRKIKILLQALDDLDRPADYYALDLSRSELQRSLLQVPRDTFSNVRCHGLLGTYDDAREWLGRAEIAGRAKCIISLGSTIGSFSRADAAAFLCAFAHSLSGQRQSGGSSMLIGLDACTDQKKVFRAYNDAQGMNAQFILNTIDHANGVLGYRAFDKHDWDVQGEWDKLAGSHNQYLVPTRDINFEGLPIVAGKRMLVVKSHKYNPKQQAQLWRSAGLVEYGRWNNEDKSYGK
ncbi:MAG: hypothetical protein Q9207_002494 [Kuettlingeria erythrocarpa]